MKYFQSEYVCLVVYLSTCHIIRYFYAFTSFPGQKYLVFFLWSMFSLVDKSHGARLLFFSDDCMYCCFALNRTEVYHAARLCGSLYLQENKKISQHITKKLWSSSVSYFSFSKLVSSPPWTYFTKSIVLLYSSQVTSELKGRLQAPNHI